MGNIVVKDGAASGGGRGGKRGRANFLVDK